MSGRKRSSSSAASKKRTASVSIPTSATPSAASSVSNKKKKTYALAKDADKVLQKCRKLRQQLVKKAEQKQNRLEHDDSGSDLDDHLLEIPEGIPPNILEVVEMRELAVIENMETVALRVATQILSKQGFSLEIPSRAASNQIYVKEWDRIVLGDKRGTRSFLNVKESHVKLFVDQSESDGVLDDVATLIGCTRSNLHVVASDKGLVVGRINFEEDGDYIDCTKMGVGGKAIPPYIDKIENIRSDAEFILLVEKEAAYMRMAEDRFYHRYPCIVITAKGQPDVATRMFLSRITSELQIPVLGLVDSDPYGLKILSVYMSGSKNMSYDSASLTTPDIKWLGLRPSDLDRYDLPDQCRLDMTENDIKTGKELLKEEFIQKNPQWMKELEIMVKTKQKAEIQALSSFGFQYITEEYLPRKLKEGDW
eukprot:CAMPEP_0195284510 /NCGR_PEP_ID=MMETSP0707-20130614/2687_1 /TAXON_ID=33640 /ORGANISM="Asterionellopsis glacialis, Strain CCMP134" /LENGTH=422 /DNA_ID=CAMNT_0040343865 /DNA_START=138 /DNA_END=1403 /DNA_ORIENTATION=+